MTERGDTPDALRLAEALADEVPLGTVVVDATAHAALLEKFRLLEETAGAFRGAQGAPAEGEAAAANLPGLFRWGPLLVTRPLGRGRFGVVYAAWDETLHREVALKLRPSESGALGWLDEARSLARVRHPSVLVVHGADLHAGQAGIWTELLPNRTLERELAERGPRPWREIAAIGRDLAGALAAIHAAGLVHGDVKAANVMLDARSGEEGPGRVVLGDFGAAGPTEGPPGGEPPGVRGTPLALAPEVLRGGAPSPSSDQYALGALLFRLATGRYPVEAETLEELLAAHERGVAAPMQALGSIDRRLARAIGRSLAPVPQHRFASARAMSDALADIVDPGRVTRPRLVRGAVAFAGVALVAGVVAGWVVTSQRSPIRYAAFRPPAEPDLLRASGHVVGSERAGGVGWETCGVGDVDGDGFGDFLVSETSFSGALRAQGRVTLYAGGPDGPSLIPRWRALGRTAGSEFGGQICGAGDVNGDGFADVLVTERHFERAHRSVGAVFLYLGSARGLAPEPAWSAEGEVSGASFGRSLAGLGDVNADGFGDVLVVEPTRSHRFPEEGAAHLYLGSRAGLARAPAWTVYGGCEGAYLGLYAGRAGDVNGDGFDDIVLGVPHWNRPATEAGAIRLYFGGPSGPHPNPDWTVEGRKEHESLGWIACGAGDVNGDGFDDIVAGAPFHQSGGVVARGRASLYPGGPNGPGPRPKWSTEGVSSFGRYGYSAAGLGDVDGDGLSDFAIGAPFHSDSEEEKAVGYVAVFRGDRRSVSRSPAWSFAPGMAGATAGSGLGAAGDLNGDRRADLLVGEGGFAREFTMQGRVTVFLAGAAPARSARPDRGP